MKPKTESNTASLGVIGVDIGKEVFHLVGRATGMQRLSLDGAGSQRLRRPGGGARKDGSGSASLVFEGYVGWGGPSVRSRPASEA